MKATTTFHYGWVIVGTGALVLFSCFGLARYSYTMLLPGMQAGLHLPYSYMGYIGTGNFAGYLVAVILASALVRRFHPRATIAAGLLLIGGCMAAMSTARSFLQLFSLYLLVGFGGGMANIPMMALVTYWFRSEQRGKAAGLVIGGNGVGIILAGILIPFLGRVYGAQAWRSGWLVLGIISLAVAVAAAVLLRNHPSEMGLEPVGRPLPPSPDQLAPHEHRGDGRILFRLGILYLVFGATFMVYGTFIVTTMVHDYGFTQARAGACWSFVGFFSLFSGVGFGTLSDRIGRRQGLTLVYAVQTAAYVLAGARLGSAALVVSIILYGSAVFAVPAIMAAAVGDYLGLSRAATAFATITLFFAFGQTVGPAGAGAIAATTGSFAAAYLLSASLTTAAAVLAATLPPPRHR